MALPQDGQNANALATVKEVPTGKKLIFVDPTTNEGGIITLEDLTTQILKKLTSQTFALDQGTKTLPAALNELNSKANIDTETIYYTDDEWNLLGGVDKCVEDSSNKNRIPTDGMFFKQFVAGSRYLMVGYRYVNGKYGIIILYRYGQSVDLRYSIDDGIFSKIS